jgi:hypothetical protein
MRRSLFYFLAFWLVGCGSSRFVPRDFVVPSGFETQEFRVRPIAVADAEKDYEAVMESIEIIHASLLSDRWPKESFTLEEDRREIGTKERLFARRRSFTYAVMTPDESRVLGSVYINKGIGGPDAAVFMWVRRSAYESGLDPVLEAAVREWMEREWPFKWVVYPGRGARVPEGDSSSRGREGSL